MSDEPKCRVCGKYNGTKDSADWCRCPKVRDMGVSEDTVTPPTPDPRERGEETFEEWYERIRRERGGAAGPLDAMDADATQMLLAAYYDRAPAPSEAVRKFSAAHTRAMSELEFTHGVGVRGDAPSEAVADKHLPGCRSGDGFGSHCSCTMQRKFAALTTDAEGGA